MHEALTPREAEVLNLLAQGMSNREIRLGLVVAQGTLSGHLTSISSKLGLDNVDRTRIVIRALELGLVHIAHEHEWHDFRQCVTCGLRHEGQIPA